MRPYWQHSTYLKVSIPHISYCQDQLGFERRIFIYIYIYIYIYICICLSTTKHLLRNIYKNKCCEGETDRIFNNPCSLTNNILRRACLFTFHITQYLRLLRALLLFDKHCQVIIIFLYDNFL